MAFNLGTIWAEIGLNTKKLDDGLMKAQTKLATADKQVNTMGQSLTRNSTKFMVAGGIMAGAVAAVGVASIKSAKEFDTSMRNVNSIAKLSEQEFQNLSKDVVDLSKKLPQSAKVLADGLYDISSSGFAGAEGMKVLEAAAKAASAGMTDTATSAKGITAVLNAYGKSAEEAAEVSDTMFATVDKGVITFEELSGGIGNVLSTANLAGIEFNELSGMIAYMTTKGVSADETMTSLNRLITSIIDPSDELAKVLKNAGYETGEAAIKSEGLIGVLTLMEQASGGSLTELQKLSPEMRALKASGALLGGGIEELTKYMDDFKDTAGATQKALDEQSKSLDYQLDLLKNNIDAIKITLGNELVPEIAKTTRALSKWIDENDDLAVILTKLVGGAVGGGGLLLLFAGALGKIRAILMTMGTGGAIGFGVVGFIVNLASAIYGLYDTIQKFRDGTANWEDDWYRLAYPMIPVLEKLLGIEKETEQTGQGFERLTDRLDAADKGMNDYARSTDDATEAARVQAEALEEQKQSVDELVESLYKLYNLNQSTTEATWDFEDALKKVEESQKTYTKTVGGSQQDVLNNINAQERLTEATENYNNVLSESPDDQKAVLEATIELQNAQKEAEEATKNSTATTKTYTASQREKQEALYEAQDALELLHHKMLEEINDTEISKKRKQELREQYILTGLEAVNMGIMSADAFNKMAKEFDVDAKDIIKIANEADITLDQLAEDRIIHLGLDISEFDSNLSVAINRLNQIDRRMGLYANGGIVGYAGGGIIPKAAGGMVVPQTGNPVPIIAHEGEMILNSSQQGNLIDALWGVANGKQNVSNDSQPIAITNVFEVDGQVIYQKTSEYLYKNGQTTRIGAGIR